MIRTKTTKFLVSAIVCLCLIISAFGLSILKVKAANEYGDSVYTKGDFDGFFDEDFTLTTRNYNSFTSLGGSNLALADSEAKISSDSHNTQNLNNRALTLEHSPNPNITPTGNFLEFDFNTAFTLFKRPLASATDTSVTISFDFFPFGWEGNENYNDQKLWFSFLEGTPIYYICGDKTAINEPHQKYNFSEFEKTESPNMEQYRRVSIEVPITAAQSQSVTALTVWFFNGLGTEVNFKAFIDNFSITRADGLKIIDDENFESFDLGFWANPSNNPSANPLENWGVTWGETSSPARIIKEKENAVLKLANAQGSTFVSGSGDVSNFGLGIKKLFTKAGRYELAFDIKLENKSAPFDSERLEIRMYENGGRDFYKTNLLKGGSGLIGSLPQLESGYRKYSYIFEVTASDLKTDCLAIDFDTVGVSGRDNVVYLDNLFIKEVLRVPPAINGETDLTFDRVSNNDLSMMTNIGNGNISKITVTSPLSQTSDLASEHYSLNDNILKIKASYLKFLKDDGKYEFMITSSEGTVGFSVTVSGVSNSPIVTVNAEVSFNKKTPQDIVLQVDLKNERVISLKNFGIALTAEEYNLSEDNTKLTIKKEFLSALSDGEQEFTMATSGGTTTFKISVIDKKVKAVGCGVIGFIDMSFFMGGGAALLTLGLIILKKKKNKEKAFCKI